MLNKILLFLFPVFIFLSCSSSGESTQAQSTPETKLAEDIEEPFLVFRKTPCFGRCPVFKASFYSDGRVVYEGRTNVEKEGVFVANMPVDQLDVLFRIIDHTPFKEMKDSYPAREEAPVDLPSTVTFINHSGLKKEITNLGAFPPAELTQFEDLVEEILSILEFSKLN